MIEGEPDDAAMAWAEPSGRSLMTSDAATEFAAWFERIAERLRDDANARRANPNELAAERALRWDDASHAQWAARQLRAYARAATIFESPAPPQQEEEKQ